MSRAARRGLGVAAALAAILGVVIVVAPAFMRPGRDRLPLVGTPADRGLRYETVAFSPPDVPITLRAWWMPAPGAKAAIVMIHGGGDDNRSHPHSDGLSLARDLVGNGYAVLSVDLRNYGESDAAPSGQVTFGDEEANDVLGAVAWLAARDRDLRVGAFGYSMGGSAVLYAAVREPRIEAVVTEGAFADSADVAPRFVSAATGLPRFVLTPFLWSAEHLHGVPLGRGRVVDVAGAIAPRPVLLIHNAADPIVPVDHCRRLAAAIPTAETWITPAPPPSSPVSPSRSPWGAHVNSYRLDRGAYVSHVVRFFDEVFVRAFAGGAAPVAGRTRPRLASRP
jgi:hypothetical protein